MSDLLPIGKLKRDFLGYLLKRYAHTDKSVAVGPGIGEDAAALDIGDKYLIAKTDPITFVAEDIGIYAIDINANDIATMGARPRWFLAAILLPEGKTTKNLVENIFSQISEACKRLDISLCGGHTEVTYGIDRPIIVGQMLGEVAKDRLLTTSGAKVGDDILLTKGLAIEATSIIARERKKYLEDRYSKAFIKRCLDFIHDPGISVVNEALAAASISGVHSMHDPTEGGLSSGLYEISSAARVGIEIHADKVYIFPESERLCKEFSIDILGVIASGTLIITCDPKSTNKVIDAISAKGIMVSKIGKVAKPEKGLKIITEGIVKDLPDFEKDEIIKVFS